MDPTTANAIARYSLKSNQWRLLLVVDIVMGDLLIGMHYMKEVSVHQLIGEYGYPNFADAKIRAAYYSGVG